MIINDNDSMLAVRTVLNTMQLTLFDILKITTTTAAIASGAVTSIPVVAVGDAILSNDDDLVLVDPSGMNYYNIKLNGAVASGDTAITIDSYDFTVDVASGAYVCMTLKELLSIVR